jgi:hypothetical protein
MVWRDDKVVRQTKSRARSRHSFITTSCIRLLSLIRNACTKSGSLLFSQFSGCWLILSVYILMSLWSSGQHQSHTVVVNDYLGGQSFLNGVAKIITYIYNSTNVIECMAKIYPRHLLTTMLVFFRAVRLPLHFSWLLQFIFRDRLHGVCDVTLFVTLHAPMSRCRLITFNVTV